MNPLPRLLRFRIFLSLLPKLLSSPPPLSLGEVAGFLSLDFILQLNTELYTELSTELRMELYLEQWCTREESATFPREENAVFLLERGICYVSARARHLRDRESPDGVPGLAGPGDALVGGLRLRGPCGRWWESSGWPVIESFNCKLRG